MGMKLKAAREASGKTQAQVAKEAGITVRGYRKLEAKDEYKAIQTAIQIAQTLNRTVEELFGAATPAKGETPGGNRANQKTIQY